MSAPRKLTAPVDLPAACRRAVDQLAAERPEDGDELHDHLTACADCRHAAIARDPLWVFRLLPAADEPQGPGSPEAEEPGEVWNLDDLRQRVHGTIRSREVQRRLAPRRRSIAGLAAAALLGVLAVLQGVEPMSGESSRRLQVESHLDSLPVVDSGTPLAWRPAAVLSAEPGEGTVEAGSRPELEILAQMSGDTADLVWIVNESLEI